MLSSTSSFERELPRGQWGATWIVAVAIAACLCVLAERAARSIGQRPSVVDDQVSWSRFRHTVDHDRRVVAFVGSSRMLLAYDAAAFEKVAPELRGVQLAINALPSIGVLRDLAADEDFRGVAVVDLVEWDIPPAGGDDWGGAREYLDRSHALWRAPGALANQWLAGFVQERFAILAMGGRSLLTRLARGKVPLPNFVSAARDRTSNGFYDLAPSGAMAAKARQRLSNFDAPPPSPEAWLAHALTFEPMVQQIRARGGDVVFVRMPTTGQLWEGFKAHYPRDRYWDVFAAKTSAHTLHFNDVPGMRDVACPDEMHLDQSSQELFTSTLVESLRAMGVFANR